jgi:hypothetical protein
MSYLIPNDYLKQIQDSNLQQLISANTNIMSAAELAAEAEAISMLTQKFDTTAEFTDTNPWDASTIYNAADRVYLDAPTYDPTQTYTTGAYTLQNAVIYMCTVNGTTGTFNAASWTVVGNQYDLYYAALPFPQFDLYATYKKGDQVCWNNSTYTCQLPTVLINHETELQVRVIQHTPATNIFPDDPASGPIYWGTGTPYTIPANTPITNTTWWTPGDNRDQQMLQKVIDIALYHLHARIAPRNIPELRITRYLGQDKDRAMGTGGILYPIYSALGWLQACARGEVTPQLPVLQPKQGSRIRYGGNVKAINSY